MIRDARRSWTGTEQQQLKQYISEGLSFGDIAAIMRKTRSAVAGQCHCMRLKSKNYKQNKYWEGPKPQSEKKIKLKTVQIPKPKDQDLLSQFLEKHQLNF